MQDILTPQLFRNFFIAQTKTVRFVLSALTIVFGSLALWASAKISVNVWPVPFTMQTMVILLLGAVYGPKLAFITVLAYLAQGAYGLPVFSGTPQNGLGLGYMLGTTGGYLAGFLPAVLIVGIMTSKQNVSFFKILTACFIAVATIFLMGVAYLSSFMDFKTAIYVGIVPFLPSDLLKIIAAAYLINLLKKKQFSKK